MLDSLHMTWRHVLFASWPLDPDIVRPHVPDAMTLDTFDGKAWLSVVGFTNVDVRPPWLPDGTGMALPELNLRTYVLHGDDPGVYFFSLDAQGVLGVTAARLLHRLPYYYARIDLDVDGDAVRFRSRRRHPGARPARFAATYAPESESFTPEPGTLVDFLVERDRYYTKAGSGAVRYADVEHEPWPLHQASVGIRENTLFQANGFNTPETAPVHLYSPGVDTVATESRRR